MMKSKGRPNPEIPDGKDPLLSELRPTVREAREALGRMERHRGFCESIDPSLASRAALYFEGEDPWDSQRSHLVFSVNIALESLKLDAQSPNGKREFWDHAVRQLTETVARSGLKPRFVQNHKNAGVFTMAEKAPVKSAREPDEGFQVEIRWVEISHLTRLKNDRQTVLNAFDDRIEELEKKLSSSWLAEKPRAKFSAELDEVVREKNFFQASHFDPAEIDAGLIFTISLSTTSEFSIAQDKIRVILREYLRAITTAAPSSQVVPGDRAA